MLAPKRQKYRKQFRGTWRKIAVKGQEVNFGTIALKAMSPGWVKDREIEAARVALARATRKSGKYWIRVFPDKPFTKKPPEVTMGSGKGEVSHFVAGVTSGRVLFEIDGLDEKIARNVLRIVASKIAVKTKIYLKS